MSAKKREEKSQLKLRSIQTQPENKICFECHSMGTANVNLFNNTFVCTRCSGILREFNHRIKSLSAAIFSSEEIKVLGETGNGVARDIWCLKLPRDFKVDSNDNQAIREFIRAKYVTKKWMRNPNEPVPTRSSFTPQTAPLPQTNYGQRSEMDFFGSISSAPTAAATSNNQLDMFGSAQQLKGTVKASGSGDFFANMNQPGTPQSLNFFDGASFQQPSASMPRQVSNRPSLSQQHQPAQQSFQNPTPTDLFSASFVPTTVKPAAKPFVPQQSAFDNNVGFPVNFGEPQPAGNSLSFQQQQQNPVSFQQQQQTFTAQATQQFNASTNSFASFSQPNQAPQGFGNENFTQQKSFTTLTPLQLTKPGQQATSAPVPQPAPQVDKYSALKELVNEVTPVFGSSMGNTGVSVNPFASTQTTTPQFIQSSNKTATPFSFGASTIPSQTANLNNHTTTFNFDASTSTNISSSNPFLQNSTSFTPAMNASQTSNPFSSNYVPGSNPFASSQEAPRHLPQDSVNPFAANYTVQSQPLFGGVQDVQQVPQQVQQPDPFASLFTLK